MKVQKPQFKPGLENRSASFALSACYTATMILRKSVTHTGKKIRILVRCSCSKTASDTDFLYTLQGKKIPEKKTTTRSGEHRTLRSGRNSVPGYPLSPLGRNPVPGYPLSPLEGGTQFRGYRFLLPGRNSVPGCCFLLSGRNSVPGLSTFSYQGGTQFRLPTSDDYTIKRSCYKLQLLTNKNIVKRKIGCLNIVQGNQIEAACPLRRVLPSRRKKGWNSVPGYLLPPPRLELSSGVTAFPPGRNSVPGLSAFSSQGGTQFRGHLLPPPRRNSVPE